MEAMDEEYLKLKGIPQKHSSADTCMTLSAPPSDYANNLSSQQTPNNNGNAEKRKRASRIIGGGLRQFSIIGQ